MKGWLLAALLAAPAAAQPPQDFDQAAPASWKAPSDVQAQVVDGVQIVGGAAFLAATRAAFALIEKSSLARDVFASLRRVEQAPCSGVDPSIFRPTFYVGDATWQAGALWYAGAVVHDSRHARLYAQALKRHPDREPAASEWKDVAGEKKALAYQLAFLSELKADPAELAYIRGLERDPAYQGARDASTAAAAPAKGAAYFLVCTGRDW